MDRQHQSSLNLTLEGGEKKHAILRTCINKQNCNTAVRLHS